ncbi:hypothetical protein IQ07DRAFT_482132, partial [Pyrenochaeta sp. DS3sAY3a]
LAALLSRKLANIPAGHIPPLILDDIFLQTQKAEELQNIPGDIQLDFLLRNRATIERDGRVPIKDHRLQCLDITRAIWFYRLNENYQMQRYHDVARYNIALFTALLALEDHHRPRFSRPVVPRTDAQHDARDPLEDDVFITNEARAFMKAYLGAVVEAHNTPTTFDRREAFVRDWKKCPWTLFEAPGGGVRKHLNKVLKQVSSAWAAELSHLFATHGREAYQVYVRPFVGSVVPGTSKAVEEYARPPVRVEERLPERPVKYDGAMDLDKSPRNPLEEALREPFPEMLAPRRMDPRARDHTPTSLRYAIAALKVVRPREMMEMLVREF